MCFSSRACTVRESVRRLIPKIIKTEAAYAIIFSTFSFLSFVWFTKIPPQRVRLAPPRYRPGLWRLYKFYVVFSFAPATVQTCSRGRSGNLGYPACFNRSFSPFYSMSFLFLLAFIPLFRNASRVSWLSRTIGSDSLARDMFLVVLSRGTCLIWLKVFLMLFSRLGLSRIIYLHYAMLYLSIIFNTVNL